LCKNDIIAKNNIKCEGCQHFTGPLDKLDVVRSLDVSKDERYQLAKRNDENCALNKKMIFLFEGLPANLRGFLNGS